MQRRYIAHGRQLRTGALALLVVVGTGCASWSTTTTGTTAPTGTTLPAGTTQVAVGSRQFLVHTPTHLAPAAPVVFVLHGASVTAAQTERYYHWDDVADANGFTVVYPQGIDNAWNAGSCCGDAPALGTDDVAFLASLVARFAPAPLFMVGVSNGAMMTLRFACAHPDVLTAIGSVAGTFTSQCDHPPAIPFVAIHGLADSIVSVEAGSGTVESGDDMRLPAAETFERVEAADHCGALTTATQGPVHRTTGPCPVLVITIDGAGHQWPGATIDAARLAQDGPANQPSTAINATQELWAFFARVHAGSAAGGGSGSGGGGH